MEENQICSQCGEEKILEDFPIDRRAKSGHKKVCKACFNELYKDRNDKKANPEKVLKDFIKEEVPDVYKALSIQSITEEKSFVEVLLENIKPKPEFIHIVEQYKKTED